MGYFDSIEQTAVGTVLQASDKGIFGGWNTEHQLGGP